MDIIEAQQNFVRDENQWQKIVEYLQNEFGLSENQAKPLNQKFFAIDTDFKFNAEDKDKEYSIFHVEYLLDHAADLLDRGIRDRAEWNELAVKAFNLGAELTQFFELDKVHQEEIKAGFYSLPYEESVAEADAENASASKNRTAYDKLNDICGNKFSDKEIDRQKALAGIQGTVSKLATYAKQSDETRSLEYMDLGRDGVFPEGSQAISTQAQIIAEYITDANMQLEKDSYLSQKDSADAVASASKIRAETLEKRKVYEEKNIQFRRNRTEISKNIQELRAKAATSTKGILNYVERMTPIKNRFDRDFREAIACLIPAYEGLTKIYGYNGAPLPSTDSTHFFDDSLLWVRDAINWIVRFTQRDQNYVLSISVKILSNDWEQGKQNGKWTFEIPTNFEFADDNDFYKGQRHVRMRGVSAFVETSNDNAGVWQVMIIPPKTSTCTHLSGDDEALDQTDVPPCRLGRVSNRDNVREIDVAGVSTLHNISPFGKWEITLSNISRLSSAVQEIEDIQIDMHFAIRASKQS